MPILEGDIKLLKSAVMADTSDGGGQMTGSEVIDGQSNNLFPDTSEIDRALGRVNLRKVFGVAHSADTATLLGAHAIITDAPNDPLVHCALMKSTAWADERLDAKEVIERYLVKGPRFTCRLMDVHYAGSMTVRLYAAVGSSDFPAAGDAIVLRNPDSAGAAEQYARVVKRSASVQTFNVFEGSSSVSVTVNIVTCELSTPLLYDFQGAPVARALANEQITYASVYTTTAAAGAQFYGIKPLAVQALTGDLVAKVGGGIFTPLVPAATIETPLIEITPYTGRGGVSSTGQSTVAISGVSMIFGPDAVVHAPTAIEPKSISLAHGATTFTDDGGKLFQGTTQVGTVDYKGRKITFLSSAPSYGSAAVTLTYKAATAVVGSAFSSEMEVTINNRGLSYTEVFNPPPVPGSFTLSYMAQGRWYTMSDDGAGKLAGADAAYGVGTINYTTGSAAITLGALPDIGSALIADWSDRDSGKSLSTGLPAKLHAKLVMPEGTAAAGIVVSWANGATNYSATTNAFGTLVGDAVGSFVAGVLHFEPNVFPSGSISVTSDNAGVSSAAYSGTGINITLSNAPIAPGSVRGTAVISGVPANAVGVPNSSSFWDSNGVLYTMIGRSTVAIGSINYATGAITGTTPLSATIVVSEEVTTSNVGFANYTYTRYVEQVASLTLTSIIPSLYRYGSTSAQNDSFSPTVWNAEVIANQANQQRQVVITSDMLFKVGADVYSVQGGSVRKGWNVSTGVASVPVAGTVDSLGLVGVTSLPANGVNAIIWHNVAIDNAGYATSHGSFRTETAPLKIGVFQLLYLTNVGNGAENGTLSGGGFSGSIDYQRGIVRWTRANTRSGDLRYNAVFLQYLPLDSTLLGLETARLPLDGKVPIFRSGGIVVVHNTQSYALPNPLTQGTTYNVGRVRVAAMKVKTANGLTVDTALYTTDLDAGDIVFPVPSDLTGLAQPFTVEHRIEDVMLCSIADISGDLTFTRQLSHDFPANTSFVSSALVAGDVFARAYNFIEQSTWTGVWSDSLIGSAPTANFNETLNPIAVTNQGAITERWAMIFTNTTTFRIVGETVGEIGTGNTGVACAPVNPATGQPYFTIPSAGWGSGWSAGNVYRFNTEACGEPFWVVRTVLQGPATLQSDQFTLAFRGDVDRP